MTSRETFLDVGDSVMAAPGPGQYDPGIAGEKVKGGHTLANRVSRELRYEYEIKYKNEFLLIVCSLSIIL